MINRRLFLTGTAASAFLSVSPGNATKLNNNYHLTAKAGTAQLLQKPSAKTNIWGYDGIVPGPVIKCRQGEPVRIEVFNLLKQPTSVHWHGIRLENAMDGVSNLTQDPIQPGDVFVYEFTPPDAGTYWYHPHNRTWEQLARGLYGTLIIEGDSKPGSFDRDYTIVVDDWRIESEGQLHEESFGNLHDWSHEGRLGNILTLNGKPYENFEVIAGERVRLRFINTANARTMRFGIAGHQPWLVAVDGQPIPAVPLDESGIELAPAQRADLVVDINANPRDKIAIVENSNGENLIAGYLNCNEAQSKTSRIEVPALKKNALSKPDNTTYTEHALLMSGGAMRFLTKAYFDGKELDGRSLARNHQQTWAFNMQAGMSEKPFFTAQKGETIRLKLVNETGWPHAIHIHGHHFQVLSRAKFPSGNVLPVSKIEENAFRDTILLQRDETAEIAFVADNPGKWMLHCHMLEHQASGMGTWFEVG